MKSYTFGVLLLICLALLLPENSEAYSAGTGRFGDESKVSMVNKGSHKRDC